MVLAWGVAAAAMAAIFYVSHQPRVPLPRAPGADKLAHATAYAVLAGCWYASLRVTWPWRSPRETAWGAAAAAALYGATDEWHQSFVPNRLPSWGDWVADALGALGFALIVVLGVRLRARRAGRGPSAPRRGVSGRAKPPPASG